MKRLLIILGASATLVTDAGAQGNNYYGWTISLSYSDPFDNSGAKVETPIEAYLWFVCFEGDVIQSGLTVAEFALAFTEGTGTVNGFKPMNGFFNYGDATQLLLVVGDCPAGPLLAGEINMEFSQAGGALCIVPDLLGINFSGDCSPNQFLWPNHTVGLTTSSGRPPCDDRIDGVLCYTSISVRHTSWGNVKSLYR